MLVNEEEAAGFAALRNIGGGARARRASARKSILGAWRLPRRAHRRAPVCQQTFSAHLRQSLHLHGAAGAGTHGSPVRPDGPAVAAPAAAPGVGPAEHGPDDPTAETHPAGPLRGDAFSSGGNHRVADCQAKTARA